MNSINQPIIFPQENKKKEQALAKGQQNAVENMKEEAAAGHKVIFLEGSVGDPVLERGKIFDFGRGCGRRFGARNMHEHVHSRLFPRERL